MDAELVAVGRTRFAVEAPMSQISMSDSGIFVAQTETEIAACFPAFQVSRPHLNAVEFVPTIRRQQLQGFQILAVRHERVIKSVAGFRITEFLAWGKVLYIDDLSTLPDAKRHGFAGQLLDWLIAHARQQQCAAVHLDTGYARHDAHRLYLHKGFQLNCHHLALPLT